MRSKVNDSPQLVRGTEFELDERRLHFPNPTCRFPRGYPKFEHVEKVPSLGKRSVPGSRESCSALLANHLSVALRLRGCSWCSWVLATVTSHNFLNLTPYIVTTCEGAVRAALHVHKLHAMMECRDEFVNFRPWDREVNFAPRV